MQIMSLHARHCRPNMSRSFALVVLVLSLARPALSDRAAAARAAEELLGRSCPVEYRLHDCGLCLRSPPPPYLAGGVQPLVCSPCLTHPECDDAPAQPCGAADPPQGGRSWEVSPSRPPSLALSVSLAVGRCPPAAICVPPISGRASGHAATRNAAKHGLRASAGLLQADYRCEFANTRS